MLMAQLHKSFIVHSKKILLILWSINKFFHYNLYCDNHGLALPMSGGALLFLPLLTQMSPSPKTEGSSGSSISSLVSVSVGSVGI